MKVAIFGDISPQKINGFSSSLVNLTTGLSEEGCSADLYSTALTRSEETWPYRGILIRPFVEAPIDTYDIVILTGCFDYKLWKLALTCKRWGRPYIVSPRSSLMRASWKTSSLKKWLSVPILYFIYFRGNVAVHYLSDEERRHSWTFFQNDSFCVPNGFTLLNAQPERPKHRRIGFLGRLDVRHKGLDILVEAIASCHSELKAKGFRAEFVGPDFRGGKAILEEIIVQRGLQDLINILPAKQGEEKARWLEETAIFVHASRYEGQPQAVFEAMGHGAIPIVTPECNMSEAVKEFGVGFIAKRDPQSLSEAIIAATELDYRPNAEHIRRYFERYDRSRIARKMINEMEKILVDVHS